MFEIFCNALSEEEQNAIEVVAGDGARWIDDCTKKYFRKARRCIEIGAHAVVSGGAITRPQLITKAFVEAMRG